MAENIEVDSAELNELRRFKGAMEGFIGLNPLPILVFDPGRRVIDTNAAFTEATGYTREQVIGKQPAGFITSHAKGEGLAECLQDKRVVRGEATFRVPKGDILFVHDFIPLFDDTGGIYRVISFYSDVTGQRRQLEEARSLQETTAQLLQKLPTPILLWDMDKNVIETNEAFIEKTGWSREKTLISHLKDFVYLDKKGEGSDESIRYRRPVTGEATVRFPNGDMVWERYTIPLFNGKQEMVNLLSVYNDITARAVAAEGLKTAASDAENQKQLMHSMIMQNPIPLLIMSTKLDLELANEAFLTLSGYSSERLRKMSLKEFRVLEKSGHGIREAVQTKKGVTGDVVVEFPTGVKFLEQHTIPLINKEGEIVSMMATYLDNTGKRKVERVKKDLADFTDIYLATLSSNLGMLATGNLAFDLNLALPTENTKNAHTNIAGINNNLAEVGGALTNMIADANMLAKAALEGKLKVRANATKHQGDYKKIVEGMNGTLEEVYYPVHEVMRTANEFAKCNFSARIDEKLHVEGDFVKLKDALNNTGIEVSKAMAMINQQVVELASSAKEAKASIEEISSGTEQIAKNASGVSTNAERGDEGITQVLRAMEDLNQTVTDVAQKAEKVSQLTEDANTLSVKGTGLAEQAERGMQSITSSSAEVEKIIVDIKAEMDKIGKIVGLIRDLANQTNLLALNAAIEAARAGEAGRGFAVVATEVKSLAQESRASAENIADMIGTLQKKSIAAGEAVASSNREVKTGSEALAQTLRSFKDIAKSIEDISRNVVEVASVSEEQAATVEEVTASVSEVHGMVQATVKNAWESCSAAEAVYVCTDQITKVIGGVNVIVDNLSKEIAKFKV
ncbi:MAG: methyl-accepting chemotaxis protein [Methanomicrobiales archaeon]|nr:methyl-accepting chemotaxis protein [Methanomicrobiales archaeon]